MPPGRDDGRGGQVREPRGLRRNRVEIFHSRTDNSFFSNQLLEMKNGRFVCH